MTASRVVGLADADAAAGDDRIGLGRGPAQRRFERRRIVAHQAEVDHLAAPACVSRPNTV